MAMTGETILIHTSAPFIYIYVYRLLRVTQFAHFRKEIYWLAQELKYLQLLSVSRTLGFGHVIRVQVNHKISFPKAF